MEKPITLDRQDGSPVDLAAGVRKPRSGSSRKPRSASHTLIAFDRDPGSPPAISPSDSPPDGNLIHEENGHVSRPLSKDYQENKITRPTSTLMPGHGLSGDRTRASSYLEETFREVRKEGGDFKGCNNIDKMGDGEGRTEWKMFQRRERRRDDEWSYDRDSNRSNKKSWKDSDVVVEKVSGKDDTRRPGSPEYERMKNLERIWKDKGESEKRYKDSGYRDKNDHHSKSSWQRDRRSYSSRDWAYRDRGDYSSKDRGYRDRGDHSSKDWGYRDRGERVHSSHKAWDRRDYPRDRDRDYHKVRRVSESRDAHWRSRDGLERGDSFQKHSSLQSHRGIAATGHNQVIVPQNGNAVSLGGNDPLENSHGFQSQNGSVSLGSSHGSHPQNGNTSAGHNRGINLHSGSAMIGNSPFAHERRSSDKVSDYTTEKAEIDSRPPTKLKLKVGGITHTIHSDGRRQSEGGRLADAGVSKGTPMTVLPLKRPPAPAPKTNKRRQRLILQENSDDEDDYMAPDAKEHAQGSEYDGFLSYLADEPSYYKSAEVSKEGSMLNMSDHMSPGLKDTANQPLQGVRKSSRIPKKRVLDGDEEIEAEPKKRRRKKVEVDSDEDLYRIEEDEEEDDTIDEDDDVESIGEEKSKIKRRKRKRLETDIVGAEVKRGVTGEGKMGVPGSNRTGVSLTARQRALQCSKEGGFADVGSSLIEFPDGLKQSASKKQKDSLTAAERQLKKEEAARKRRQQVEKTAKEIQAVAIQKILSQDSQRKKREGKLQKQREEMEQEKKAAAMAPASNSIRWVFGPTGNIVSFSQDVELPAIFSGPCSYPQERERCAGPSCNNAYRYRDSKTLLPLCSLQCYRAVQKPPEATLAH